MWQPESEAVFMLTLTLQHQIKTCCLKNPCLFTFSGPPLAAGPRVVLSLLTGRVTTERAREEDGGGGGGELRSAAAHTRGRISYAKLAAGSV